jgi:predicted ATP-grasp superfamily ATP-dependent carboligase
MTPLILGLGINGWNVARALLRGGVRPVILDDTPSSIFWSSRKLKPIPVSALHGEPLLEALQLLDQTGHRFVLISALEESIAFLNLNRARVPASIRLCFPPAAVLDMLLDKRLFYERARQLEMPVTPMYFLEPGQWRLAGGNPNFPCVLKTRRKVYVQGLKKAYMVNSHEELCGVLDQIRRLEGVQPEDFLIQEWVPGGDGDVFFCLQYYGPDGELRASFTGRKIRQWPPLVGGTSSAEPADAPPVEELTTRFFRSIAMRGICSMEFKRSAADGRFYMIEPTACRADYQEGVAIANGCNIPLAMFHAECGLPWTPPPRPSSPTAWVNAGDDLQSASAAAGRKLGWFEWWRSLPGRKEFAIFCREDWGPFAELIRRKIAGRLRRLAGA